MPSAPVEIRDLVRQLGTLGTSASDEWSRIDLTFPQFRALHVLQGREHVRVSDLGDAMRMSLASASALAERLERLGYVTRERDAEDRRIVILRLSAKGRRLVEEQQRRGLERLGQAVERMTPEERSALATTLRAFLRLDALERAERR